MQKKPQITEEQADAAATLLVRFLRLPLSLLARDSDPKKLMRSFEKLVFDPEGFHREAKQEILSGSIDQARFERDFLELSEMLRNPRRAFDKIKKELPAGLPGRRRAFKRDDEPRLARLALSLVPVSGALRDLRSRAARSTVADSIGYLAIDFPDAALYLGERLPTIERLFKDKKLLPTTGSLAARARRLAYLLAGIEYGMSGSYALRTTRTVVNRHRATIEPVGTKSPQSFLPRP